MSALIDFYRFQRARTVIVLGKGTMPMKAAPALAKAREMLATHKAAKAHYETVAAIQPRDETAYQSALKALAKTRVYEAARPSVTWSKEEPGRAYVESPEALGLRLVGRVTPESHGGRDTWDSREACGWHTDPHGDTFKDGSGLCYGLVYQLPGRRGQARFVAGYQFGGVDGGPALDLGTVYTSASNAYADFSYDGPQGNDDAHDAARAADSMAERAAEKEREYQTAYYLGTLYAEAREAVTTARKEALELLAERRAIKGQLQLSGPLTCRAICDAIRVQVESLLDTITGARDTMRKAIEGDGPHGLCVYMGDDEQGAFCEGAGLQAFPG